MALQVIERQTTEQWYELSGTLAASEIFPNLLSKSESIWDTAEQDEEIKTEREQVEGKYDGCPQEDDAMEDEIAEFTKSAIAEFHDEALNAATAMLTALKPGDTLLQRDFEDTEMEILEEAAKALGIAVPFDPVEAAQMVAEQAAQEARLQQHREQEVLRAKQTAEVVERARLLFQQGNSHTVVRARFPEFASAIATLVGELRRQGVQVLK
jgi:hypothetical protein